MPTQLTFVGRTEEVQIMEEALNSTAPEMVAVIGRRRVGKTHFIRTVCSKVIHFEMTGIQHATLEQQLQNFAHKLNEFANNTVPIPAPSDWMEAFYLLRHHLAAGNRKQKPVIFFDEVPWIDTHRSGFLTALAHFWNEWGTRNRVMLIICGSAASWMISKVVNNRGGLHNRITRLIRLKPFTLSETEMFLKSQGVRLNRFQIIQVYMAMGGIPHYLKEVRPGESAAQTIDRAFFSNTGLLQNEFNNLYAALFDNAEPHLTVIKALAKKWKGLTRNEIIEIGKINNGGGLSNTLTDLEQSSFITSYVPFGKKKRETLYRLTDEYSLFYLRFVATSRSKKPGTWQQLSTGKTWAAWSGYAFESLCMKHIGNIKKALGISGVYTEESGFAAAGSTNTKGIQLDLLIDRADGIINICEMKFHAAEFTVTKAYATQLRQRKEHFQLVSKTKKMLQTVLCAPYGIFPNAHSLEQIEHVVNMDDLFGK